MHVKLSMTKNTSMQSSITIEADKQLKNYWSDLYEYRELFYFLALRDFQIRYKQTVVGVAWAFLRPLLTMVVFTVIFGKVAKLPTDGTAPYSLLVFSAMLPWYFFSSTLQDSSMSLVNKAAMVGKLYFPRIIIPVAPVFVNLIDFLISFFILIVLLLCFNYMPGYRILLLPVFLLIASMMAIGIGLWVSSVNVKYRDFRLIVPFIVQLGLYVSPVGFSSNVIPEQWRLLYSLNPMVGVIEGFRWCVIGGESVIYLPALVISIVVSLVLLITGVRFFLRSERQFADVI